MNNICKECKFWKEEENGWGYCKIGESEDGEKMIKESKFYASDAESYHAWLMTENDFWCCMFEEKNKRR